MNPRISMVSLGVLDLQRSIDFYEHGLGLPRLESPPEVAFFKLQGSWLGLYGRQAMALEAQVSFSPVGEGVTSSPVTLAHNVKSEPEVDAIVAQAQAAGASVTRKPATTDWGGYSGYFTDPDGHLWEIAHNPFMWVGPGDQE